MIRKSLPIIFFVLCLSTFNVVSVHGQTKVDNKAAHLEMVKAAVARMGTGVNARVKVRLWDKTTRQGIVGEASTDSFTIISTEEHNIGVPDSVAYSDVEKINGKGASSDYKFGPSSVNSASIAGGIVSFFRGFSYCPLYGGF